MAAENYIRDLSQYVGQADSCAIIVPPVLATYLTSGNLSDLTLNFGEKSWKTHKALVCAHSKWFQKAITIGFTETESGVVTLEDDAEFADAIDCMVSYCYDAGYDVSKYGASEALLHAQVAIMADKYDCASLLKLARSSFASTVKTVESDDWIAIATLIYDHTTTELPAHVELRDLVISSIASRPAVLRTTLENHGIADIFRSNADLATDLLLSRPQKPWTEDSAVHIFVCSSCCYAHIGSHDCANATCTNPAGLKICPQCRTHNDARSKKQVHRVELLPTFSCPWCDGAHTKEPEVRG